MAVDKDKKWAKALIKGIDKQKEKLLKDEKATATYWNGDSWGSIDGIRDADAWVNRSLAEYVLKHARRRTKKK